MAESSSHKKIMNYDLTYKSYPKKNIKIWICEMSSVTIKHFDKERLFCAMRSSYGSALSYRSYLRENFWSPRDPAFYGNITKLTKLRVYLLSQVNFSTKFSSMCSS